MADLDFTPTRYYAPKNGTALIGFCHVVEPKTYENESTYTIDLILSEEDGEEILARAEKMIQAKFKKTKKKKLVPYYGNIQLIDDALIEKETSEGKRHFEWLEEHRGKYYATFKIPNYVIADGVKPEIKTMQNEDYEGPELPPGSKVCVKYEQWAWAKANSIGWGCNLRLVGVLIGSLGDPRDNSNGNGKEYPGVEEFDGDTVTPDKVPF